MNVVNRGWQHTQHENEHHYPDVQHLQEGVKTIPLSLTIRPSCGVPGDYKYFTDSAALLRMLHKRTDLSFDTISRFEGEMYSYPSARLMGVELS